MNLRNPLVIVGALLALFLLFDSVYTIKETERGLVRRLREIHVENLSPGLHFKMPFVDDVLRFDGRVITLDSQAATLFTLEKKPLIVDAFVKWRIENVASYYQATSGGDESRALALLQERVIAGLRNQISRRDMHEVISGQRDELMQQLTRELNSVTLKEFGIKVVDVRVKRIELPPEVSGNVYQRMRSERQIEAQQHRATGEEVALGIRASAEREATVLLAEAYRTAEQTRGDGDAKAASIYAAAFNQDPEFYSFYRSLAAYKATFKSRSDVLLLDPDSDFFKYLKNDASRQQ